MKHEVYNGKPITRHCVVVNMPLETYHSQCCVGPSVSSSNLRSILEANGGSPAHFFMGWSGNPDRIVEEDLDHFTFGRAAHHLLLGQELFSQAFAVRPPEFDSWRTQASKDWRDAQLLNGKGVITPADVEVIQAIASRLAKDPYVRQGILNGQIERSLFFRDEETGLWCKSRPDAIPTVSGDFADFKTTTSVQMRDITKTISDFGYHQQAALVREAAEKVLKIPMSSFSLVFAEKKPPYCVRVVNIEEEDLDRGHAMNVAARRLIAKCLKAKRWPGPGEGYIATVRLPQRYRDAATKEVEAINGALGVSGDGTKLDG